MQVQSLSPWRVLRCETLQLFGGQVYNTAAAMALLVILFSQKIVKLLLVLLFHLGGDPRVGVCLYISRAASFWDPRANSSVPTI